MMVTQKLKKNTSRGHVKCLFGRQQQQTNDVSAQSVKCHVTCFLVVAKAREHAIL